MKRSPIEVCACEDAFYVLGLDVSSDITDEDVKNAYRRLVLQMHPDKCTDAGAAAAFICISEAYAALSTSSARQACLASVLEQRKQHRRGPKVAVQQESRSQPDMAKLRRWKMHWAAEMQKDRCLQAKQGGIKTGAALAGLGVVHGQCMAPEAVQALRSALPSCVFGSTFKMIEKQGAGCPAPAREYSLWLSRDLRLLNWRGIKSKGSQPDGFLQVGDIARVAGVKDISGNLRGFSVADKTGRSFVFKSPDSDCCSGFSNALLSISKSM